MKFILIFFLIFNYIIAEEIYVSDKRFVDSTFSGLFDESKNQRIYGIQKFDTGGTFYGKYKNDEPYMGYGVAKDGTEALIQIEDGKVKGYEYEAFGRLTFVDGAKCFGYLDSDYELHGYVFCERHDSPETKSQESFYRNGTLSGEHIEIYENGEISYGYMLDGSIDGDRYYQFSDGNTYKYRYRNGKGSNAKTMNENDYIELNRIKNTLNRQYKIFQEKWDGLSQDWNNFVAYVDRDSLNSDSKKLSEKSNLILSIQELLTELGYSPGSADGVMGQKTSSAIKAFQVTYDIEVDGIASEKLLIALQVVLQSLRIPEDKNPYKQEEKPKLTSTGSGFYVNNENIVSNYHVIDGCDLIKDSNESVLKTRVIDKMNDLVVLEGPSKKQSLSISPNSPALGEEIYVAGFPLYSDLKGLNFTSGNVSALKGFGEASSQFQYTAPSQPGNSGGPILNKYGSVIGIVVAGFKSDPTMRESGVVVQNANFGIKNTILKGMLDDNKIKHKLSDAFWSKSQKNLASIASKNSVLIKCYSN